MNTGFTDPPFSEPDNFYQTGFVPLAPNTSIFLVLDFTALGVINRNHTTNLGFQVGGELVGTNPDTFQILVNAVPEPTSALLWIAFAGGAGAAAIFNTRRAKSGRQ